MSTDKLIIKGAKQNNLRNITLELPHNRVIAVTGLSGSGKSSLAFETVFAEGQWRFIESLSTYARLFLEKLDRPDVESIENVRPAIALEQKNPVRGARSTVGTLTELYDIFRLLYSKIGVPYCTSCGQEVRKWDPASIVEELITSHEGGKAMLVFNSPLPPDKLSQGGYARVLQDGRPVDIEDLTGEPPFEVVLDRLVIRDEPRLSDSVESAFSEGHGRMKAIIIDGPSRVFSSFNTCERCDIELPEPSPILFSFNHPVGACPECKGFGNVLKYDEELIVPAPYLSLEKGAIEPWEKPAASWWRKQMRKGARKSGINLKTPYGELPEEHKKLIFTGDDNFYGVDSFFEELEGKRYKLHVRVFLSRYRKGITCPSCRGKRLNPEALAYRVSGMDIHKLSEIPISGLIKEFSDLDITLFDRDVAKELLSQVDIKLRFLSRVGLEYLTLTREGKTLSGGEYQRVNLSNQLASRLMGTLYVLDEPTVGLHKRDTERVSDILSELSELGNTVLVVEHDKGVIERADWVVELGPGGGHLGGNIVFTGPIRDFMKADTLTSRHLRATREPRSAKRKRPPRRFVTITGASGNNLKDMEAAFPLDYITVVSGVSGSGKSTLVMDTFAKALARELRVGTLTPLPYKSISGHESLKSVKLIDQAPIGKSPRSNPATYLKIFDYIRKLFSSTPEARAQGHGPGYFSFNVPGGRCETCKGEGYEQLEMYFFEDLYIKCEDCGGKRYSQSALDIQYLNRNIHEVLNMTVDEAASHFSSTSKIAEKLSLMREIGLGYLRLGQPATTLSGGEAQRLKLCSELGGGRQRDTVYVLDEPTVGLHPNDVDDLMKVIRMLVDEGNSVIIIEHNLDVISQADWVIDMGPEGGERGGEIIFAGLPEDLPEEPRSHTGRYLRQMGRL
jgi:excinuclease ABC subunit A